MESNLQVTSWDRLVVGDQWTDALVALAASGQLDRGRLIDECLDAFLRDFPPNHVGWYECLHDRLAPSPDEATARAPRYLALLAARSLVKRARKQAMDAPENNLEVSAPAARIMRHCLNDPGYRGPLPTRYRG